MSEENENTMRDPNKQTLALLLFLLKQDTFPLEILQSWLVAVSYLSAVIDKGEPYFRDTFAAAGRHFNEETPKAFRNVTDSLGRMLAGIIAARNGDPVQKESIDPAEHVGMFTALGDLADLFELLSCRQISSN